MSRVVDKVLCVVFNSKAAEVNGSLILRAAKEHNLFVAESKRTFLCAANSAEHLWYNRFGHVNFQSLSNMAKKKLVIGMKINNGGEIVQCRTCMLSKIFVAPFPQELLTRSAGLLNLIYTDRLKLGRSVAPSTMWASLKVFRGASSATPLKQ